MLTYTAREAAAVLGVPVGTVRTWREYGLLVPCGRRGPALIYRLPDIYSAEREARRNDPTRRRARRLAAEAVRQAG